MTRTGAEWRRLATAARDAQVRAELAVDPRGIRISLPDPLALVETSWTTTRGVRYPADARCTAPLLAPEGRRTSCNLLILVN